MLKVSGGNLIGVATEDQFVDIIHQEDSNRSVGCFLEGSGIYFENLDTNNIKYSLRLRQNPPPFDRWFTEFRATRFQIRGARVEPKFVFGRMNGWDKEMNEWMDNVWTIRYIAILFSVLVNSFLVLI